MPTTGPTACAHLIWDAGCAVVLAWRMVMQSSSILRFGFVEQHPSIEASPCAPAGLTEQPDVVWPQETWYPDVTDQTLFMTLITPCDVGAEHKPLMGGVGRQRLHVRRSTSLLIITEMDDQFVPGRFVVARHLSDLADHSVFQLLTSLPAATEHPRFRPGSGAVWLMWKEFQALAETDWTPRRRGHERCLQLHGDGGPADAGLRSQDGRGHCA